MQGCPAALFMLLMNAEHKSALGVKDINSCELVFFLLNPGRAIALCYTISKERETPSQQ